MSRDVPDPPARRPRVDAELRRRSLGLAAAPPRPPAADGVSNRARSFRELLDAIPDLDEDGATAPAAPAESHAPSVRDEPVRTEDVLVVAAPALAVAEPAVDRTVVEPAEPAEPVAPVETVAPAVPVAPVDPAPVPAVVPAPDEVVAPPGDPTPSRRRVVSPPPRAPWWRRLLFGAAVLGLVAAIPVLGREGYDLIVHSTDGRDVTRVRDPQAPGYESIVDSTPTMVLVQSATDGSLRSLTFLSLNAERGGTVIFVPNMAEMRTPAYGLGAIEMVYDANLPAIPRAQQAAASEVGLLLNVGIDQVTPVDDRSLAQLAGPIGTIPVDNPAEVVLPDGTVLPSGQVALTPQQVGPYLGHLAEGEDQTSQFVRHERVWRSWLDAVAASSDPAIVPGPADQGIGLFLRTLASGEVNFLTLPGMYDPAGLFVIDDRQAEAVVLDAVPVPDPPQADSRAVVRLLNGVAPGAPSSDIVRRIVGAGGSVAIIGNGPSFGRDVTEIVHRTPEAAADARRILEALGVENGTVRLDPAAPDTVDLTVIVGRDVPAADGGGT